VVKQAATKEMRDMCPQLKDTICIMADMGPEHLECVRKENCLGAGWRDCQVYISQFFFDKNYEFIE
jgi:hypothetical protein